MVEILQLNSGAVIRGNDAEVFLKLKREGKKLQEEHEELLKNKEKGVKTPRASKPVAMTPVTLTKPRLELPKQKQVAKPEKTETVEIKPKGDWLGKLQSLTAEKK